MLLAFFGLRRYTWFAVGRCQRLGKECVEVALPAIVVGQQDGDKFSCVACREIKRKCDKKSPCGRFGARSV